jgi:hypothetical protein
MRLLLGAEVAVVVTVLVAVTLFVTSFVRIVRADLGFDRDNVMGFDLTVSEALAADLISRAGASPGVRSAAFVDGGLPLQGGSTRYSIEVDGYGETTGGDMLELKGIAGPYVDAMGMRLLNGRALEPTDRGGSPLVALVNEEASRRFFNGQAVGRTFGFRGRRTVVGVVANSRLGGPEVDVRPELYLPLTQNDTRSSPLSGYLVVRTQDSPETVVPAVQAAIREVLGGTNTAAPIFLNDAFWRLTATRRFNAAVMAVFGAVALLIGISGIYGVVAFTVTQQVRAIGLRRALGATGGRIFGALLADTGRTLAGGIALGLFLAWLASGLFSSVVFGVEPGDPRIYVQVAALAALAGLLAAVVPGVRAARIDPIIALRRE